MIVFLYFSLKKYIDENLALYGAFIASVVPCFVRESVNGYVDIIVAILTMVSAILLFNWFTRTRKTGYLLLSAIFIGGAAWTKNDGIALFAAMSLALLAYLLSNLNKKELGLATASSRLFAFIAAGGIVFLPFRIFVGALGIRNHMISGSDQILSFTSNLWRVPYIFNQFLYEFFLNTSIWLYFWIFFFLMIFVGRKRIFNSDAKYILLFMLLYSAFLFYVYMVTALGSSVEGLKGNLEELERLLLHIAPTAVFVIMLSFNKERSL
jgi:4-amino-4-deoxy-L-arabinose transferase-like glycosyltransferase